MDGWPDWPAYRDEQERHLAQLMELRQQIHRVGMDVGAARAGDLEAAEAKIARLEGELRDSKAREGALKDALALLKR